MKPQVLLCAERLRASNSGIGRVARLMARVLGEEIRAGKLDAEAITLSDDKLVADIFLPVSPSSGSRIRFVVQSWLSSFRFKYYLFDSLGMSRARSRIIDRPTLAWIHGIDVWESAHPNRLRAASATTVLLSNSNYTRMRAEEVHGGFERAKVCWLATEEDLLPESMPKLRTSKARPTVLMIGRLDPGGGRKGHREMIKCWQSVVKEVPDARLFVVGDGPGRVELEVLASKSQCANSIEFKGFVSDFDLRAYWQSACIFAMPSRGEGFGLVYIEAMRYGLPVIASIHDAAPEINLDNKTGFNVNLDCEDELPERIIYLLKNASIARAMGIEGQNRWLEHFRFRCFQDRFRPLLYSFLDNSN